MKTNTELIVDENGIEILVTYRYEKEARHMEECHGYHYVGGGIDVELTSVEVAIRGGDSIDLLPFLNEKQKDSITDNLEIW